MYRINEIFCSLQGEGFWTGTPIVFIRMSGCNLVCPFCDTDHRNYLEMSAEDIIRRAREEGPGIDRVCLTGGEPSLQADSSLVEALHAAGYRIHIETNGTRPLPEGIDWVTLSPKADVPGLKGNGTVVLREADEVKVVYLGGLSPEYPEDPLQKWAAFPARWHFLQPCSCSNSEETVAYILAHPVWRLSLQTHKYLNIR